MCTVLLFYHTKQIDLMLPWAFTVRYHRTWLNWASTSVTHLVASHVGLLCFYQVLTSSVIYYWRDLQQHEIYRLNFLQCLQVKAGGNERVATGVLIPSRTNFRKLHASWCKGKTKNLTLSRLSVKFTHHILILGIITCHAFILCHPLIRGK